MKMPVKKKPFTWSPTAMKVFKTCQLKWWGTWGTPSPPPYEETPATIYGNKVHSALENAVLSGQPLPAELAPLQKWVDSVNNLPGTKFCEGKFAFDKDWNQVEYFDKNVWGRMVLDLRVQHTPQQATVFDYKTGKSRYDTNDQLELAMIAAQAVAPQTQLYRGAYIYTKEDKVSDMIEYDAAGVQMLKTKFNQDITEMEDAFAAQEFEPTKNGMCRQYCSVTECPFHGK